MNGRDERIRAAVIIAPAIGLAFTPERLAVVTEPMQLRHGGRIR